MRRLQRWRDLPQERAGGLKAEWISTCLGWQTIMIYFILTNRFVTLQQGLAKKSRWSHCAFLSVKMQFSICSRHYFAQCLFHFFHPQSGITYVFGLIAEVLFKGPFHKNDLFQLCPLGKKTTNRQEYYLAIRKKKIGILAQQFLIRVCLSFSFPSLQIQICTWEAGNICFMRLGCIKAQSSHFYSFVSRWRGNEGVKQMPLLREQVA